MKAPQRDLHALALDTRSIETDDAVIDDGDELCINLFYEECPIGALRSESREKESESHEQRDAQDQAIAERPIARSPRGSRHPHQDD